MTTPPGRLAHRPRDPRGFVIPYTQFVGPRGPDFRVLDHDRMLDTLRHRLCGMCGAKIERDVYFIGGPLCVENGYFYDPPMHRDCAVYALTTCPHLARMKGRYSPLPARLDGAMIVAGEMSPDKAEWFGLMRTSRYQFQQEANGMVLIKAKLPWLDVERWQGGATITTGE
jgi:hypothetical protein